MYIKKEHRPETIKYGLYATHLTLYNRILDACRIESIVTFARLSFARETRLYPRGATSLNQPKERYSIAFCCSRGVACTGLCTPTATRQLAFPVFNTVSQLQSSLLITRTSFAPTLPRLEADTWCTYVYNNVLYVLR